MTGRYFLDDRPSRELASPNYGVRFMRATLTCLIEAKWQRIRADERTLDTPNPVGTVSGRESDLARKLFVMGMFPYRRNSERWPTSILVADRGCLDRWSRLEGESGPRVNLTARTTIRCAVAQMRPGRPLDGRSR